MSWIDKIKNDMIIVTGDGEQYFPTWLKAKVNTEYNISEFNFPNIKGTLVKRSKPMGRKYDLEIYFQGEDHLEEAAKFRESADNEGVWQMQHPLYDTIFVHPAALSFDDGDLNTTKVTGTILETILEENPRVSIAPLENIQLAVEEIDDDFANAFTEVPTSQDLNVAANTVAKHYSKGVPIIELPEEFETYTNLFNSVNAYITTAIETPILFMRSIVTLTKYPSLLTASVGIRMKNLLDQWETLKDTVEHLFGVPAKQSFQNQAAANLAAMCYTAATPLPGNYTNSVDVIFIIDKIINTYDEFLTTLDSIQDDNGGNPANFIPDANVIFSLNEIISMTISSLFEIALNAKQQRSFILENDSDIINLTHRLYSMDDLDNNILELIANNNWGLIHYIVIKKNTKILYYI